MSHKRFVFLVHLMVLILGLFSFGAFAQMSESPKNKAFEGDKYESIFSHTSSSDVTSFGQLVGKMVVSLAVVVGLIILTLYLIRRFFPQISTPMRDSSIRMVKLLDKISVGPKQDVLLLWTVDRILVLGSSQGALAPLSEIKDQNVIENHLPPEFEDILNRQNMELSEVYGAEKHG